ncbi:hypothetical protein N9Y81_00910 [Akkermansiaceae bacterium]|jgi:hypothetical protein|nr:hypothetical protein [Akkermansiaceae bacterium]
MIDRFLRDETAKPFDRYADRIEELDLWQSTKEVWDDDFSVNGDIDYHRLFELLVKKGIDPYLVFEQPVESGLPDLLDDKTGHRKSRNALTSGLPEGE